MKNCECGCGQESTREFLPGHDQKLRVALEAKVGGLLALRGLISEAEAYANGSSTEAQLLQCVRRLLSSSRPGASAA
jgi:hypothetical protein